MRTERTSKKERISYFGFFLGQNIIYIIMVQYLAYFYTEKVGLTPASVAILLFVAKLWDAINDPMMGVMIDKSNLKNGKFLPWIRFVIFALPLATILLFTDLGASAQMKLVLAYITYILWGMIYTVGDAPIFSLSTVMTDDMQERDRLISYGRLGAAVAALLSAVFLSLKTSVGYTYTAVIYAAFAFIVMLPVRFTARERIQYQRNKQITLGVIVKSLFKNKYLLLYFIGYLAAMTTNTIQLIAAYFANSNLGNEGLTTVILATTIVPLLFVVPFLPKLIQTYGKRKLTIYSSVIFIVISVVQYFIGYDQFALFLAISAVRVIFMQIPLLIYGMFTADCIEYGAFITGERTEGIAFSVQTFVTKLGGALASVISLQIMQWFGYIQQAQSQSDQALKGIWMVLTIVPTIGFLVMLIIMIFFYDLTEDRVQKMIDSMKRS